MMFFVSSSKDTPMYIRMQSFYTTVKLSRITKTFLEVVTNVFENYIALDS